MKEQFFAFTHCKSARMRTENMRSYSTWKMSEESEVLVPLFPVSDLFHLNFHY